MHLADGEHLRSDLSCTLFLNDPDAYEGGRLIVSDTYGEHAVALPAGDAILYPASSLHRVEPVTRGARLATFFRIQTPVRDADLRPMLFELDTATPDTPPAGPHDASALHLTCVYYHPPRRRSGTLTSGTTPD